MAVRTILRMGDPRLLQVASPVESIPSAWLDRLLDDMFDTMRAADGVGLAAPQIGEGYRVVVFGFDENARYPQQSPVPRTVLINPRIEVTDPTELMDWEGCLSVPGMRGRVARPTAIRYQGIDATGEPIDRTVSGFHARVVLHECDHLDGILYPQRISDMREFGFEEALAVED
jgi:peptide deformylase